ncbi:DUF4417 domain-containing protein [Streptomyces lunaelactis]|uniref:DUF4417 domain-containing protein n=1 Tax=Streptomyces lunaelactis TaxID=1535768 RepID=UPI001585BF62|nr:DUF4417 domain-containing protein [Streptomyces lunaelactis]NUK15793.1 DUF4417 domain-containing protein [Streptomyces lunaelactis]
MTLISLPTPRVGLPLPGRGCDCRTCAFWAGPDGRGGPATVEPLCSGSNSDCSYCGCAATEAGSPTNACGGCPIRCGSRTDIARWMGDVGGTLAFDDIVIDGEFPDLPAFIPMTDGSAVTQLDASLRWPAYGVGMRRVFSPDTHTIYPRFAGKQAREALALRDGQKAVLVGYGEDPLVEAFWTYRKRDGLVEEIASQGWDLVLSPNYSIYGNWPRTEHLLNMRRCLLIAQEFADAGVAAVPNVYWFRLEDLKRYTAWIEDAPPPAIAVNVQTVRENNNWDTWALPGLYWLAENLPADLPVILTGLSRVDRIAQVVALFGNRLTLISQNPHQYALHGAIMTANGREDIHARPADAFAATVQFMASLLPGRQSS